MIKTTTIPNFDYTKSDLIDAFKKAGIRTGDTVFSHSNIGFFGISEKGLSRENMFRTVLTAFQEVLGPGGTLVVPTFTYSFCRGQEFDPEKSPSTCGLFTEMFRQMPQALRSQDPIFSVSAIGPKAKSLTENVPEDCFGKESFWELLLQNDGLICNLNFDAGSTFIHYVERRLDVPYRFLKRFDGILIRDGQKIPKAAYHFCRDLSNPKLKARFELFDFIGREKGLVKTSFAGRGAVVVIRTSDVFDLIKKEIRTIPELLTAAANDFKCISNLS